MKSVLLAYRTAKYIEGSRLLSSIFIPLSHLWKDAAGYRKIGQFSWPFFLFLFFFFFFFFFPSFQEISRQETALMARESSDVTPVDYSYSYSYYYSYSFYYSYSYFREDFNFMKI